MLVAYRRWREVGGLEQPEQWVRRTCANLAVSQFRRRMVELRVKARLSVRPPPDEVDETSEEFWTAVRALPYRQAQTAALRFVYDLPIADIARTLGCSEGTVKQHLSRARKSLAATLDVEGRRSHEVGRTRSQRHRRTGRAQRARRRDRVGGPAAYPAPTVTSRLAAAGVAVAVVAGGWTVLTEDSGTPEPASPPGAMGHCDRRRRPRGGRSRGRRRVQGAAGPGPVRGPLVHRRRRGDGVSESRAEDRRSRRRHAGDSRARALRGRRDLQIRALAERTVAGAGRWVRGLSDPGGRL